MLTLQLIQHACTLSAMHPNLNHLHHRNVHHIGSYIGDVQYGPIPINMNVIKLGWGFCSIGDCKSACMEMTTSLSAVLGEAGKWHYGVGARVKALSSNWPLTWHNLEILAETLLLKVNVESNISNGQSYKTNQPPTSLEVQTIQLSVTECDNVVIVSN